MDMTEKQRRWWFANHPEYSRSSEGKTKHGHSGKEEKSKKVDPKQVDAYVDNALKYVNGPVAELLKSTKRNFGTQAYPNEHDKFGDNDGIDRRFRQPRTPQAIIRAPDPPNLSDRARSV